MNGGRAARVDSRESDIVFVRRTTGSRLWTQTFAGVQRVTRTTGASTQVWKTREEVHMGSVSGSTHRVTTAHQKQKEDLPHEAV